MRPTFNDFLGVNGVYLFIGAMGAWGYDSIYDSMALWLQILSWFVAAPIAFLYVALFIVMWVAYIDDSWAGLCSETDFLAMSPDEFERALARLCKRDGCKDVRVVGGSGDLGADVLCTTPTGKRLLIQAKRHKTSNRVGSPAVQRVGGTYRTVHGCSRAVVVTTSDFTAAAKDYAAQAGIDLYNMDKLVLWSTGRGPTPWGTDPIIEKKEKKKDKKKIEKKADKSSARKVCPQARMRHEHVGQSRPRGVVGVAAYHHGRPHRSLLPSERMAVMDRGFRS